MRLPMILAILIALQGTLQKPAIQKKAPSHHKDQTAESPASKTGPSLPGTSPPTDMTGTAREQDQQQYPEDRIYSVKVLSQPHDPWIIAYVVITGALGVIAIITLGLLYTQTKAAHSAQRARLDVIFNQISGDPARITINALNYGNSAAHIVSYKITHTSYPPGPGQYEKSTQRVVHDATLNRIVESGTRRKEQMFSFNGNHFATYRDGVEADTTSEIYTALVQYVDIFKKLIKPASYTNTFRERPLSCFLMYLQSTTDPQIASHPVTASQGSNNRAVCQVYNCPKCSTWNIRTYLINPLRVRM